MSIPDSAPPPLPATGPVGGGVLLYVGDDSVTPSLVLESGEHFRLPSPPAGEGRLGTMNATLSPDGRWLGHRRAAFVEDDRYIIRDLTGNQPSIEVSGSPLLWSADGRFLVISDDPSLHLVEPSSGNVRPLSPSQHSVATVLPGGRVLRLLSNWAERRQLHLQGEGIDLALTFAADPSDECWCPVHYVFSPDEATLSVQLGYENGRVPGTDEKTRQRPHADAVIAVYDLTNGSLLHRIEVPAEVEADRWFLLSDTGSGLLLQRTRFDSDTMHLLDPGTGNLTFVAELPTRVLFATAGHVLRTAV